MLSGCSSNATVDGVLKQVGMRSVMYGEHTGPGRTLNGD